MGKGGRAIFGRILVPLGSVAAILASAVLPARAQPSPGAWSGLQGGAQHTGLAPAGAPAPPLRVAWRADPMNGQASAVAVAGSLAVAEGRTSVDAFDPANGTTLWTASRAAGPVVPPAIAGAGSDAVVLAAQGTGSAGALVGLGAAGGHLRWTTDLGGEVRGAPVAQGSTAYVATEQGDVFAVEASSGSVLWKARVGGAVDTSPALAGGFVLVIAYDAGLHRERLQAIDAASGALRWSYDVAALTGNASSVAVDGTTAVAGFGDGSVRAFRTRDGRLLWSKGVRSDFSPGSSPAIAGGWVYALDRDGGLYAFGLGDGVRGFDYQFAAATPAGTPLVVGSRVVVGRDDGSVVAVDVRTGNQVSRVSVGGGSVGALAPAGALLLAPTASRGIVALAHDPVGTLTNVPSPTKLFLGTALGWYAAAAAALFVVIWVVFRFLVRVPPEGGVMAVPPLGRSAEAGDGDGNRDASEGGA